MPTTHSVRTIVSLSIVEEIVETSTPASGASSSTVTSRKECLAYNRTFQTGTGSNQFDRGQKKIVNLAGAAQDLDLSGSTFQTPSGTAWTAAELGILGVWNKATTTGYTVKIGGDAASVPIFGAAADFLTLGPDGLFLYISPIDGATVTAGTGDIIQLDPTSNTLDCEVIVAARSV